MNFKLLRSNKNVKNGVWLYLLQFFNTIIPLLTLPYITRILGAEKYGTFSIALNIIGYLQVVIEYGFEMSATRDVTISDKNTKSINYIFTSVLFSRIFLFCGCVIIAFLYITISNSNKIQVYALFIMLSCLLGNVVQVNWLYQGMQEMKYISLVSIISRSISTICIFCFVKGQTDLLTYCFLFSISPLLGGFLGLVMAFRKYNLKIIRITFTDIITQLKKSGYVFTTQLSSKVFGSIGVTFLGFFSTEYVVGVYSAIQKLPAIILLAWSPISQVLYPITSSHMKNSFNEGCMYVRKARKIILPIFFSISLIIGILSHLLVKVAFGNEYAEFSFWSIPLLIWMILGINNNLLGIQTLLAGGYDKQYSKCFQIGVICNIIINFIMVYFFDGFGASLATVISEGVLFLLLLRELRIIKTINAQINTNM